MEMYLDLFLSNTKATHWAVVALQLQLQAQGAGLFVMDIKIETSRVHLEMTWIQAALAGGIVRDWQIFGHSSNFSTWSELGTKSKAKVPIFIANFDSGLERAFDRIPNPKIIYWEVPISLDGQNNFISCLDNSISC